MGKIFLEVLEGIIGKILSTLGSGLDQTISPLPKALHLSS